MRIDRESAPAKQSGIDGDRELLYHGVPVSAIHFKRASLLSLFHPVPGVPLNKRSAVKGLSRRSEVNRQAAQCELPPSNAARK